jgi:hypothetical protein
MATVTIKTENFWGEPWTETIEIERGRDAAKALGRVMGFLPRDLLTTFAKEVRSATSSQMKINSTCSGEVLFPIKPAREGSNEDCGSGQWWLRDNLYLSQHGPVRLEAKGSWRNYGAPHGTSYDYDSGKTEGVPLTPELWQEILASLRCAMSEFSANRKKMDDEARRLIAALAD